MKKLASWNGVSRFVVKGIIHQTHWIIHHLNTTDESTNNAESPEVLTIYVRMPYYSHKGLWLLKSCFRKI